MLIKCPEYPLRKSSVNSFQSFSFTITRVGEMCRIAGDLWLFLCLSGKC